MMTRFKQCVYLCFMMTLLFACSKGGDTADEEAEEMVITPTPPVEPSITEGFVLTPLVIDTAEGFPPAEMNWEVVDMLTDEFDGTAINETKWNDIHPVWSGRAPSQFKKGNTFVEDGYLKLRSTSRVDDISEVADPNSDIWVDAASMTSKEGIAKHGYYYEAKMKASDLSMTSSFWFRIGQFSEIDVIEHIGHSSLPQSEERLSFEYAANTHYYGIHQGLPEKKSISTLTTKGRDTFHAYGLWWKDPNTLIFYLNGKEVMTINPRIPFDEDLYLIFDTEVFTFAGLPTIASLKDNTKNTMLVDFVRTYKVSDVVFDSGLIKNGSFEVNGTESWYRKGEIAPNTLTTDLNDGVVNMNLKNGGSLIQKVTVSQNTEYKLDYNIKVAGGSAIVEIVNIKDETVTVADWTVKELSFNSGDNTEIYVKISSGSTSDIFLDAVSLVKL